MIVYYDGTCDVTYTDGNNSIITIHECGINFLLIV
jgi:hypothetical protein